MGQNSLGEDRFPNNPCVNVPRLNSQQIQWADMVSLSAGIHTAPGRIIVGNFSGFRREARSTAGSESSIKREVAVALNGVSHPISGGMLQQFTITVMTRSAATDEGCTG